MTSNVTEKLDPALIRPGRVDKLIYLGHILQRSAEAMFLRTYKPDPIPTSGECINETPKPLAETDFSDEELNKWAVRFSACIPTETFTPAQLQGYLLEYRTQPKAALDGIQQWVKLAMVKMDKAKKKAVEKKSKERKEKTLAKAQNATNGVSPKEHNEQNGYDAVSEAPYDQDLEATQTLVAAGLPP